MLSTIKKNGETLCYQSLGEGPPLLLLIPQSTAPLGYETLLNQLSKYHQVILYDPRDIADRIIGARSGSIDSQANAVADFLQVLDIGPVGVLGYSTGCGVSLSLAATCPELVANMILVSPWTHGDDHLQQVQRLRINAAQELSAEHYACLNASLLFSPEYRRANQEGFAKLVKLATTQRPEAGLIKRRLEAILAFDARPLLSSIKCNTLVACAVDDQLMPCWFGREIHAGLSSSELIEFGNGGHMLLDTCRDEITPRLLEHFSSFSTE